MDLIAQSTKGDWFFDGELYCQKRNNQVVGTIKGEYLPDPDKLWQNKCKGAGVEINSQKGKKLKPSTVIYKLKKDWDARTNS